jgi:pilus assembly protein CpaC
MIYGFAKLRLIAPLAALLGLVILLGSNCAPARAENKIISPSGQPITLDVSKGRLIQLGQPANSVFVADPDVADVQVKSPTLVYIFGKAAGETTLYAVGDNDEVLLNSTVRVRHNIEALERTLHDLVPYNSIQVSTIDDNLVLEGTMYSSAEAEDVRRIAAHFVPDPKQIINKIKVEEANQVNIRVRVAEVSRNIAKQFGINWNSFFNNGHIAFSLLTSPLSISGLTANSLTGSITGSNYQVEALIDALEQNGLVTILAEPNLTAISGEPASFLAGGEFPIPVPQSGTGSAAVITIDYKKFGVSLNFVATVHGNSINLHVAPEVSELSTQGAITIEGFQVPALTTRRADTTLELASGQSFAIGGLLQNNIIQTVQKFPWLGDVPILGTLFRSNTFQRNESELVIIVTPYIVRPVSTALRAPTDGLRPANDKSQILNGDTYRPQVEKNAPVPATRSGTGLIGPAGFDLD